MRQRDCSDELASLGSMKRDELRIAWARRMKTTPPSLSVGMLRLALAPAIQSKALGGITKSMDRKLRELAAGKIGPSPGTRFTRAWQGKIHVVTVTADVARDGSNFAHARSVMLTGGSRVCDYDRFNDIGWSCNPK